MAIYQAIALAAETGCRLHIVHVSTKHGIELVDEAHRPVGMLSVKHVVRYLAELFPEEVLNLPPQPELLHPGQVDGG